MGFLYCKELASMSINSSNEPFTIRIRVAGVIARVDLSLPQFEKQVLSAAGRFRSLKRRLIKGGKPASPVVCSTCREDFPSMGAFRRHKSNCSGKEVK